MPPSRSLASPSRKARSPSRLRPLTAPSSPSRGVPAPASMPTRAVRCTPREPSSTRRTCCWTPPETAPSRPSIGRRSTSRPPSTDSTSTPGNEPSPPSSRARPPGSWSAPGRPVRARRPRCASRHERLKRRGTAWSAWRRRLWPRASCATPSGSRRPRSTSCSWARAPSGH